VTVYLAWAVEFILEASGAYLYFRRSKILSCLLGVCAAGDLATFLLFGSPFYSFAFWIYSAIKGLMLCGLACEILARFVAERNKARVRACAAILSFGGAAVVAFFFWQGETLKDRFLDGEIAASMILLGLIGLGWITRLSYLSNVWRWIAAGFVLLVGWDLVITALWTLWDGARHWYPLGTIAAQAVWVLGGLRKEQGEVRLELQSRAEMLSVDEVEEGMVM
jgi:hypothetical protein